MTYQQLIETVSIIMETPKIHREGLRLVYLLTDKNHKQMQEELFYKSHKATDVFEASSEDFEVEIEDILVVFENSSK